MDLIKKRHRELKEEISGKLKRHFGRTLDEATEHQLFWAVSLTLRDKIMEKWSEYKAVQRREKEKELYYLSFEFLMGRSLSNNLLNSGLTETYRTVLHELGLDLAEITDAEPDAGLGNGGLGRLAACFLDSLATLNLPSFGCSIRYEYGLFMQRIIDGYQVEMPDPWLRGGSVWEIARPEEEFRVNFGGSVNTFMVDDKLKISFDNATTVLAVPYDVPVVGYESNVVNTLRLWSACSPADVDLREFGQGHYLKAGEEKALAEVLSKVLYPEDNHYEGKALRLKQQYFFVSATVQWIIKRHKKHHGGLHNLVDKVVIHINDTHPTLAIPELMRILLDEEGYQWDEAWDIVTKVFAYTNHTILSEALERWPLQLFRALLPRIWMIVEEINRRLIVNLRNFYGDDWGKINYMAIEANGTVNMANLCLATCSAVNGVSKLHTDILVQDVFHDYYRITPYKFFPITNGITFRRWIKLANPELADLISSKIGGNWLKNPDELTALKMWANDEDFGKQFMLIKQNNKAALAKYIEKTHGIVVDINSIFDVQVKRLHEYKRQLLNVLHILYLYNKVKEGADIYPRTFIFGAKASPGYHMAKLIIKLINSVADIVNNDATIENKIKVVFIENYSVSLAEKIIPATDLSEQISTAGKEASGTGNMKFMLNGALTIGTLDGANVEMSECVGLDNIFIFGMKAHEVKHELQHRARPSQEIYIQNPSIKKILDMLIDGTLSPSNPKLFYDIYHSLLVGTNGYSDEYMVIRDLETYCQTQEYAEQEYRNSLNWCRKAILNTANSGFFSSDRTIKEYNEKVWKLRAFDDMSQY